MKTLKNIHSLPRAISKLGYCSRSQALQLTLAGRVKVNSKICRDPHRRVDLSKDKIEIDNQVIQPAEKIYIALNKPRGLVTTLNDEKNRETVYKCFENKIHSYIFPVGRLDKASEGLLLFTNDTDFAEKILNPENHIEKTYHVQINKKLDDTIIDLIRKGVKDKNGEILPVKSIKILRIGQKNCWVEIVLDEGKNRHIRRIFESLGIEVLRLIRIAIGNLELGDLKKGEFRFLSEEDLKKIFGH